MTIILEQSTHTITEDAITASIVQAQGQVLLTAENNIITTVANVNDAVTLTSVSAGSFQRVVNIGANRLQIFPAAGQDLGSGVNNSKILNSGDHIEFIGVSDNTWRDLTPTAIGTGFGDLSGPGVSTDNAIAVFDGTSGKNIKNSTVIVDVDGVIDLRGVIFENQSGGPRPVLFSSDIANETLTLIGNIGLTGFIKTDIGNFATSGFLRMNAADKIAWRNNANTGDLLLSIDISDNLLFNGVELLTTTTGLTNPLAVDLNFSGNDALNIGFIGSNATPVAGTGFINMGKTEAIAWRNNAGVADVSLSIDGSDNLLFNGLELLTTATGLTSLLTSDLDFDGNNALKIGFVSSTATPVAGTGFLRMAVTDNITWRNNGGVGDLSLSINNSDKLVFNGVELLTPSTGLTNPLTVDLDFDSNNAINVASIGSDAAFTPTGGFINMPSSGILLWRNNANTNNHELFWNLDKLLISINVNPEYTFGATELDFDGNNAIKVGFITSNVIPEAGTGFIRMGATETVSWRNNAANADLSLSIDGSDNLLFNGSSIITSPLTGDFDFDGNNALKVGFITSNVIPEAGTGFIRMGGTETISWRNNAGNGDLPLSVNASNNLLFNGVELLTPSTGLTNPLTEFVNFAGQAALSVLQIQSATTPTALLGLIAMGHSDTINWRNSANNGDLPLSVNASDKLLFKGVELLTTATGLTSLLTSDLDFDGNSAIKVGFITSSLSLVAGTGFIRIANTETISWRNNAANADLALSIDGSDDLVFNGDLRINGDYKSNSGIIADAGKIRLGNTNSIEWRNTFNTGNVSLSIDVNNYVAIAGGKGINLENNGIIRWDGDEGRVILNDTSGFIFDIKVNDRYDFKIADIDEYTYNATEANFFGNNLVNVGLFESNAANPATVGVARFGNTELIGWRNSGNGANSFLGYNAQNQFEFLESNKGVELTLHAQHSAPIVSDIVSKVVFRDFNTLAGNTDYGVIITKIESLVVGSERGSMSFEVPDGASSIPFMVLNEGDRDSIVIKKSLDLQKINAAPPDPPLEEGRVFVSTVNGANNGLFVKIKQNNSIVEVQIA